MENTMSGKRCYFEEEEESESSPLGAKKLRLTPLDRLIEAFPKQLCLEHADGKTGLSNAAATSEECAESSSAHANIPVTNCLQQKNEALMRENVALKEQQQQTEALMKAQQQQIEALMREKKEQQQQTEALMKEQQQQTEAVVRENVALKGQVTILKRGVISKHERQKELEKEVSTLKVEKYALKMKKQAQEGSSMHWWFHPDVC